MKICDNCPDKVRCALGNLCTVDPREEIVIEETIKSHNNNLFSHVIVVNGSKTIVAYDNNGKIVVHHTFANTPCIRIIAIAKEYNG